MAARPPFSSQLPKPKLGATTMNLPASAIFFHRCRYTLKLPPLPCRKITAGSTSSGECGGTYS